MHSIFYGSAKYYFLNIVKLITISGVFGGEGPYLDTTRLKKNS